MYLMGCISPREGAIRGVVLLKSIKLAILSAFEHMLIYLIVAIYYSPSEILLL